MRKGDIKKAIGNILSKYRVSFTSLTKGKTSYKLSKKEFIKEVSDDLAEKVDKECARYGCHKSVYIPAHKYCSEGCGKAVNSDKFVLEKCKDCNLPFAKLAASNRKYCDEHTKRD